MATKLGVWNRALNRIGETDDIEDVEEDRVAARVCRNHYDEILRDMLALHPWSWAIKEATLTELSTVTSTTRCNNAAINFQLPVQYRQMASAFGLRVYKLLYADSSEIYEFTQGTAASETAGTSGVYVFTPYDETDNPTGAYVTVPVFTNTYSIKIESTGTRNGWEYAYALPGDFVYGCGILADDVKFTHMAHANKAEYEIVANPNSDGWMLLSDIAVDDMAGFQYIALIDNPSAWPTQFAEAFIWRLAAELADALKKDPKVSERCWQRYAIALDSAAAYAANNSHLVEPESPMITARG
jgi:hypothetical protein